MKPLRHPLLLLCAFSVAALAACTTETTTAPNAPDLSPQFDEVTNPIAVAYLCKGGLDAGTVGQTFDFTVEATGGSFLNPNPSITAVPAEEVVWPNLGVCKLVYKGDNPSPDLLTITELPGEGFELESVRVWTLEAFFSGEPYADFFPSDGSVTVQVNKGQVVLFKNRETPPGGEGCTPGYWRQQHHYDSWVGYSPGDLFSDVFGVGPTITLGEAVQLDGGGANALMRHAVAALLNASSPDVDYELSEAQIISMVQDAFASGDFEETKDVFEGLNESGCDLD